MEESPATSSRGDILLQIMGITVLIFGIIASIMLAAWLPADCSSAKNPCWKQIVAKKLCDDRSKIPPEWILPGHVIDQARAQRQLAGSFFNSLLDDETRHITSMDLPQLHEEMAARRLSAVQVVTAFSMRAAYAHQICGLLLEIGFESALEQARELDRVFSATGQMKGPLHGLPFTMKDLFHIKGMETSAAYVGWIGTFEGVKDDPKYKKFDSELVRQLKSLGAIPIGKTSLATGTWSPVNNNNILGHALNPFNQHLSAGGSSGGEAAVQALRGSAFGFGTDIGGSVSMPASYQGVYSLKPSDKRISLEGAVKISPGQQVMPAVAGIMGSSVAAVSLVFQSLLMTEPWRRDPSITQMPWLGSLGYDPSLQRHEPLAFGFLEDDGIVTPHPPVARATRTLKQALEEAGHEILSWNPPTNNVSIATHGLIARGNGCIDVWEALALSGEPMTPELKSLFPNGRPRPPLSLQEHEDATIRLMNFRREWLAYWESSSERTRTGQPVRAVISPVTPYAGVTKEQFNYSAYASSMNVLDYPTFVLPVTVADQNIDEIDTNFLPLTAKDDSIMKTYNPKVHHGTPVSLQIIGRTQGEENLLAMARIVEDALKRYSEAH